VRGSRRCRQDGPVKTISLEQAAHVFAGLPDNPRVVTSGNFATPLATLAVLDANVATYRLNVLNAQAGLPDREGVVLETVFVGPGMRKSPRLRYVPCRLSLLPTLFENHFRPDVVLIHVAPARKGMLSLGIEVNVLPAAIEAARAAGALVVAQVNPQMPYTYGDAQIDPEDVDLAIEVDAPITNAVLPEPDEISRNIGALVAARIPDGATLQLGIGGIPDAVLGEIAGRREGLRVWTEMISDGILRLEKAGSLDASTVIRPSFLFGSTELYEWVDGNERVRMIRTEKANDPGLISRQPLMTSVNAALQVDLFDQANASRINGRIYSGFGGSTDFIVGAMHARGGQAFVALASWHPKANVSTIVPLLDERVTHLQHTAVVTERGVAEMIGYSQNEQARSLIDNCAHPDARDELEEEAAALGLL
jgi:acyl-CoA hydrolase